MKNMLKIGDYLIVLMILLVSYGIFFISNNKLNNSSMEKFVSIQVNGSEIKKVKLDSSSNGLILPIETDYGYNVLEFTDSSVRSIEASCPDKIDVKQGYISNPGETIVCLPNRLLVEIVSIDTNVNEVDLVN